MTNQRSLITNRDTSFLPVRGRTAPRAEPTSSSVPAGQAGKVERSRQGNIEGTLAAEDMEELEEITQQK